MWLARLARHAVTAGAVAVAVLSWALSASRMLVNVSCVADCSTRSSLVAVTNAAEWSACCVLLLIFVVIGVQTTGTPWMLGFLSIVIAIDIAGYGTQDLDIRIPVFALSLWLVRRRDRDDGPRPGVSEVMPH